MRSVSLTEHQTAVVDGGPDASQFSVAEVEALDRAQRRVGVTAFRWNNRRSVRTSSQVGILSAPGIQLEILPKVEGLGQGETRDLLVRMIATAWDVPVHDGDLASHDRQTYDLLELLIHLFARRLRDQVRRGLSRAYKTQSEDLGRLRGKLDITRQFTRLAASPQILACRYDAFTADIPLNRLLLATVMLLMRRSRRSGTQRLLAELATHFEEVQPVSAVQALSDPVPVDRITARWAQVARLAREILLAHYQTTQSGSFEGIALLFDMNWLFEAYVAATARKVLVSQGFKVRTQSPRQWLAMGEGGGAFQTRPDVHIEGPNGVTILDAKWKRIDPSSRNHDVDQADVYQMHGYAHVYGAQTILLVYPHHQGFSGPADLHRRWKFSSGQCRLGVLTFDLSDRARFGTTLLSIVESGSREVAAP